MGQIKIDIPGGHAEDIATTDEQQQNYFSINLPTPSITWVENPKTLILGIDYIALTIYASLEASQGLYRAFLGDVLGDLQETKESRFYEKQFTAGAGFYLQADQRIKNSREHTRFILPGSACEYVAFERISQLVRHTQDQGIEIKCTRLDLRIDNCGFTPLQFAQDVQDGKAKTRAERSTIKIFTQPLELDEAGNTGTEGMYLGARTSERYLRIYNQHGFTRFELECKDNVANDYLFSLVYLPDKFNDLIMGFCMDFIELDTDYWREFTRGYKRIKYAPKAYKDQTLEGFRLFLLKQCAIIFSIVHDIYGHAIVSELLERGRQTRKDNPKYSAICHRYDI